MTMLRSILTGLIGVLVLQSVVVSVLHHFYLSSNWVRLEKSRALSAQIDVTRRSGRIDRSSESIAPPWKPVGGDGGSDRSHGAGSRDRNDVGGAVKVGPHREGELPASKTAHRIEAGGLNWPLQFALAPLHPAMRDRRGRSCSPDYCEQWCDPACAQLPVLTAVCDGERACAAAAPAFASPAPASLAEDGDMTRVEFRAKVLYPLFSLTQPQFAEESFRERFQGVTQVAGWYRDCHAKCPSPYARDGEDRCGAVGPFDFRDKLVFSQERFQLGEVVVVRDGVWAGKPDDSFFTHQCWEGSMKQENQRGASHSWVLETDPSRATIHVDKAFVFLTPVTGGAFFQHFIDRGWSKLMQVYSILAADPDIKLIYSTSFDQHKSVADVLGLLGFPEDRIIRVTGNSPSVHAKHMLFSCVAPHYHPYTYQRAIEALKLPVAKLGPARNKIVYLTRRSNSRRVTNEMELLQSLRNWISARGVDLEVVVFEHRNYKTMPELLRLFREEARFVIGPHGGAFYNSFFADPTAIIIEFFPVMESLNAHRWPEAIWWPTEMLGMTYYQIDIVAPSADMVVNPESVIRILEKHLP